MELFLSSVSALIGTLSVLSILWTGCGKTERSELLYIDDRFAKKQRNVIDGPKFSSSLSNVSVSVSINVLLLGVYEIAKKMKIWELQTCG